MALRSRIEVPATPVESRIVWREREGALTRRPDELAVEEPLEIRLAPPPGGRPQVVTVTMRTPGHDFELAAGFLLGEGIVWSPGELRAVRYCSDPALDGDQRYNVVTVELSPAAAARLAASGGASARLTATSSSCGVCGTASIEALTARLAGSAATAAAAASVASQGATVSFHDALEWPQRLRGSQRGFSATGGLHAAALVDATGELLVVREDIGRHNAVDKVIGWALQQVLAGDGSRLADPGSPAGAPQFGFPLCGLGLVVSGRTSFEIVQKALAAGVGTVVSVSAASSLAARLAELGGITLVGFVRDGNGTVYSHPERLRMSG